MDEPDTIILKIKELDPDIIAPGTNNMHKPDQGGSKIALVGRPGCFQAGTEVLMRDGTLKNVEKIQLGEKVMGDDHTTRTVINLCHGVEKMYTISFADGGKPVVVNEGHTLLLKNRRDSKDIVEITVRDYLPSNDKYKNTYLWFRKVSLGVDSLVRFTLTCSGEGEYFGFTLDGNHRFLLGDRSVVRNSGKSSAIAALLYAKKHIFPVGMVMSGTEDTTGFFKRIFPSLFVFNSYDEDKIRSFIERQKIAKEHLEIPWAVLLVDDCTENKKIFNTEVQHTLFKLGRHYKLLYLLSTQHAMDFPSAIRTSIDGAMIFREPLFSARKSIWENYASVIPKEYFNTLMDKLTDDHTAIYIHNSTTASDWQDCVFWYKAPLVPPGWKFGCRDYKDYHEARYNPNYPEMYNRLK